jgi:predicted SAM-dependent methyltransferase
MTKGPKTVLQLGCGGTPKGNAVNHDRVKHSPHVDVAHDLNRLPWPWPDCSFEHIVARAVLEHLDIDLVESLNECWRLLRPGGTIFLKLPYVGAEHSYDDPTHRWFFTLRSLDQFDPDTERGKTYGFYTPRKWRILSVVYNKGEAKASTSIIAKLEVRK